MIANPMEYLEVYAKAGADLLVVHVETITDPLATIRQIHDLGVRAGLVINPETSFALPARVFAELDLFLVMSVHPGFYGQSFIADVLPKVANARKLIDDNGFATRLQVDGGIAPDTAPSAREAGADVFVAGSAVFKSSDYAETIRILRGD